MALGRPTRDPKATLLAVRLAERHRVLLERRADAEDVGVSEALRRCLDEWARTKRGATGSRARKPTRGSRPARPKRPRKPR